MDPADKATRVRRVQRWALGIILLVGAAVFSPAVRTPFLFDDLMHSSMIEGTFPAPRGPTELYDFVNARDRAVYVERGLLPWWAQPELSIRFFRPLASALRWSEQRLIGPRVIVLHLHSFVWWAASVLAASALFGRLLGFRGRILATAVFALGPWHLLPLAWVANREVLMALTLGCLALSAQLAWHGSRRGRSAGLAALGWTLALASGEYALCFGGYVLALEALRVGANVRTRLLGLSLFALPAAAYLVLHVALGYGTRGSSFYLDPVHEPLAFLENAPRHFVILLGEAWLTVGAKPWGTAAPAGLVALMVAGAGGLALAPLRRAFAAQEPARRRVLAAFLAGSFLALVPVLAVVPAPRLAGVSAVGMAVTLGLLLEHVWFPRGAARGRFAELAGAAAALFAFTQLVRGPVATCVAASELRRTARAFVETAGSLRRELPPLESARVVVLRGMGGSFFGPFALDPRGVQPRSWQVLAHTGHILLLRVDSHTLELVAARGDAVYPPRANLFRNRASALAAGDSAPIHGARVSVEEIGPAGPWRVRVRFDEDLDDARITWVHETFRGLQRVELPKVGFGVPLDP